MKRNMLLVLIAGVVASASLGCGEKNQPPAGGQTAATSTAAPAKAPEAPAVAKSVPVNEFLSKIAPTTCASIDQCKNDKVKALTSMMGTMIASFGAMDNPALSSKLKPAMDGMKKDKRFLPSKQECETIGSVALEVSGMTQQTLEPKIGKTVKYDGEKAVACLAAIGAPLTACNTEVKLSSEPKMSEIDGFEKELRDPLDAHTKACESVLTGTVQVGATCEYDYECAGEHTKCKKDPKAPKKKACVAGSSKR